MKLGVLRVSRVRTGKYKTLINSTTLPLTIRSPLEIRSYILSLVSKQVSVSFICGTALTVTATAAPDSVLLKYRYTVTGGTATSPVCSETFVMSCSFITEVQVD